MNNPTKKESPAPVNSGASVATETGSDSGTGSQPMCLWGCRSTRKHDEIHPAPDDDDKKDENGSATSTTPSSQNKRQRMSHRPRNLSPAVDNQQRIEWIEKIKTSYLGDYLFHGTGNPLAVRSPSTPPTLAVDNMVRVIQSGYLGQLLESCSSSSSTTVGSSSSSSLGNMPQLRTERGKLGSFWADRLRLAGQYGWTGLILEPNADTSKPLPISKVVWFVAETESEKTRLQQELRSRNLWASVCDKVVTLEELARRTHKFQWLQRK